MSKRVTIVFDDDVMEKLRRIQAQEIKKTSNDVSFSAIVNEVL